ncbi:MAG TPA: hypothetical protein VF525_08765 [Pyrinomonadaceae bacterium]|jgi:hypothetical protein
MRFAQIRERHHWLAGGLLSFYFFPLLWLAQYNYPSGDDFKTFVRAQELGVLGATKSQYFHWTGRYSSFFLQSLLAVHGNWWLAYRIMPVVVFCAGFGCLFYFFKTLFDPALSRKVLFTLSASVYVFLVSLTPDITTGFYWLATNMQYLGGVFVSLLIFALNIKLRRAPTSAGRLLISGGIVLLLGFLAGLNEISILFMIAIYGALNFFHVVRFRQLYPAGLIFLAASVLFGLLALFAPGNFTRIRHNGTVFHLLDVALGSLGLTCYFLVELLTTTPLLLASALYLLFLQANRERLAQPLGFLAGLRWYWVLLALCCIITVPNVALFSALGVSVNSLPYRLKNAYVYSIVLCWFFGLTILFVDLAPRAINFYIPKWLTGLLAAFIGLFLLTGFELKPGGTAAPSVNQARQALSMLRTRSICTTAYQDLISGRATRYYWQNEERMRQLRGATGDTVDLSLYSYVPETIFIMDVNHPYGAPDAMSKTISGQVKHMRYVATGPPTLQKPGF